jgi:IS30 family transposase
MGCDAEGEAAAERDGHHRQCCRRLTSPPAMTVSARALAVCAGFASGRVTAWISAVDRTAEAVRDALLTVLAELPESVRLTLTWDPSAEMAYQQQIAPLLRDGIFFAHPGRPQQRGTNAWP